MKDPKIASHQIDVVEIMKKIRQSAGSNRADFTLEEKTKREAKSQFLTMVENSKVPSFLVEEVRQMQQEGGVFAPYDPQTLYFSARPGFGSVIGWIRRLLRPITKLFINLDPLAHEVNRLTLLNNFYLKTIQDLIYKTSSLSVELHNMKKRPGGHHHRPNENHSSRHRRPYRDRGRRENNENRNPRAGETPATTEPSAQ